MRVYGYVRVSTAEQASNGDSLDTQRQQITGYAMMKGWEIAQFFVEGGVSGSVPLAERPEGQPLLAGAGKGDVIITSRLDRAFRSAADALATLEELKADGVALHMIDLGGDVCGNGISKLVFTILSAVAEMANAAEQAALARMKALRAEQKPLREISKTIASEFQKAMTPMTVKTNPRSKWAGGLIRGPTQRPCSCQGRTSAWI
jgi:DNA invertase Pin-like site-specific DNA recombinase